MSEFRIDQITNQAGTAGPQIAGITTFSSTSGMLMPLGPTEYRGGRGRGIFGGGTTPGASNTIDYVTISTLSNALDFGDLSQSREQCSACSSSVRGLIAGGYNPTTIVNIIDYVTISSTGNAFDFGDLSVTRANAAGGCASSTRGIFGAGGSSPTSPYYNDVIDYLTIASLGNATSFGNDVITRGYYGSCSSTTRGIFGGGERGIPLASTNVVSYITIASTGNALDFGDLTSGRSWGLTSCSNTIRGLFAGGSSPTTGNVIDYITIASLGDAIDFGDLTVSTARQGAGGSSSSVRALFSGGTQPTNVNIIDYVTIATTGNASSFGTLTQSRSYFGSCSDAHGGLGD